MSRGDKFGVFLFGLALLAQAVYAADSNLEKAKQEAIYLYSSEKAIQELERLSPPAGFVLLSYEEEFLLYSKAIQDADVVDKPKYWEHIDFLLAKHDSIVEARKGMQVVDGESLLEKRHLAINVNHRGLRFAMAVRDIPRETREFYGIYLERLALNYGGGRPEDLESSTIEWKEFRKRFPNDPSKKAKRVLRRFGFGQFHVFQNRLMKVPDAERKRQDDTARQRPFLLRYAVPARPDRKQFLPEHTKGE